MKIYHLIVSFFIYPSSKYPLTPALLPSPLPQLKVSETRKIYFGLCATPSHGSRLIQSWKSRKVAGAWGVSACKERSRNQCACSCGSRWEANSGDRQWRALELVSGHLSGKRRREQLCLRQLRQRFNCCPGGASQDTSTAVWASVGSPQPVKMVLLTMIARVADGLPLAASMQEDEQVSCQILRTPSSCQSVILSAPDSLLGRGRPLSLPRHF